MKIIKFLLIFIVTVIAIALIAALFIKKEYSVSREVTINKPKQEVYEYVKYLKNQDNYSYWASLDSNMQKTYTGTDATVGFVSAWKGNKDVGSGEQEIIKMEDGKRIDYALRFKEPMESNVNAYMSTDEAGAAATKVKWALYGTCKYPMNLMNPFMDGMMGDDLEAGLSNLKKVMEGK
jgi:uncharacterized membrane protein